MSVPTSAIPPFFIFGCGRSGTTLLRAMLHHHPRVAVPPEALSLIDFLRSAHRLSIDVARRAFLKDYELREWGVPLREQDFADCTTVVELIERVHELYARQHGKQAWGHKTPRMVRHADLLADAFPDANFVHVVRDPRAVARSFQRSPVHQSNALYAARRWRRDVAAGRAFAQFRPDRAIEVRYEDLVTEPQATLRRVCDFLGIGFDPVMLNYTDDARGDYGAYHEQIHEKLASKPDPGRIELWRESLTPRQLRVIESVVGSDMTAYGYQPISEQSASAMDVIVHKLDRVRGLAGQIAFSLRKRSGFLPGYVLRKLRLRLYRDLLEVHG